MNLKKNTQMVSYFTRKVWLEHLKRIGDQSDSEEKSSEIGEEEKKHTVNFIGSFLCFNT